MIVIVQADQQFECRSGWKGKHQNVSLALGPGKAFSTEKAAPAAAEKWVAEEMSRQNL